MLFPFRRISFCVFPRWGSYNKMLFLHNIWDISPFIIISKSIVTNWLMSNPI